MLVVYAYGRVIQIDMSIPVTVDVWKIVYIILSYMYLVVIDIGFGIFGCRPIAFVRKKLEYEIGLGF